MDQRARLVDAIERDDCGAFFEQMSQCTSGKLTNWALLNVLETGSVCILAQLLAKLDHRRLEKVCLDNHSMHPCFLFVQLNQPEMLITWLRARSLDSKLTDQRGRSILDSVMAHVLGAETSESRVFCWLAFARLATSLQLVRVESIVHCVLYYAHQAAKRFVSALLEQPVVRQLLRAPDHRDVTPVALALDEGKFDLAMLFVQTDNISYDAPVCRGLGLAAYVAAQGNVEWLKDLIRYYNAVPIDMIKVGERRELMEYLARRVRTDMLLFLLENGLDMSQKQISILCLQSILMGEPDPLVDRLVSFVSSPVKIVPRMVTRAFAVQGDARVTVGDVIRGSEPVYSVLKQFVAHRRVLLLAAIDQ